MRKIFIIFIIVSPLKIEINSINISIGTSVILKKIYINQEKSWQIILRF